MDACLSTGGDLYVIDLSAAYADGDRNRTTTNFAVDDKLCTAFARVEGGFKVFATMRTGDGEKPVHGVLLRLSDSRTIVISVSVKYITLKQGGKGSGEQHDVVAFHSVMKDPGRMWQTVFIIPWQTIPPASPVIPTKHLSWNPISDRVRPCES